MKALVLAGGSNTQFGEKAVNKALLNINGRPMVDYVVEALDGSRYIDQIMLVGLPELVQYVSYSRCRVIPADGDLIDNLLDGLKEVSDDELVLIASSDIPMLTTAAVDDFIAEALQREAAIYYPIVSKEVTERRFPGVKRTYVRLREGVYTGGNLLLIYPEIINRIIPIARYAVAKRKQPLQMCRLLGWQFVLRLLLGRLSLGEAQQRVSEILELPVMAVVSEYAEIGTDVDKPSDLELAVESLAHS